MGKYAKKNRNVKSEALKTLHPDSRKAGQLMKKICHESRVDKKTRERDLKLQMQGERLMWFKENMGTPENGRTFTKCEVAKIADSYFHRLDPELAQIDILKGIRPKQHSQKFSKESSIKHTLEQEIQQFQTGSFEMPDFYDASVVEYLRLWDGQLRFVNSIKMRKYSKRHLEMKQEVQCSAVNTDICE